MMIVGFDISQIAHGGGVATYTIELVNQLLKIGGLELKLFYSSLRKRYSGDWRNVKQFPIPPTILEPLMNNWRFVSMDKLLGQMDVYHSSDWIQPSTQAKKVTTFHDVIPLKYPEWSEPRLVKVHRRRVELVEQEIDKVIAVSQTTKQDLLGLTKIPEEKIVVIYEGVGQQFKKLPNDQVEDFRRRYKLPDRFILAVSGRGNRRNLDRIKEASRDYQLVITGQSLPFLRNEEMPLLYNAASLLLYPSLYEGFGLPILEAMACGVAVVTSNLGAMKEIAGGAALLVDPLRVDDIKKSVDILMNDVQANLEKTKKGLMRADSFKWDDAAMKTFEVYKSL